MHNSALPPEPCGAGPNFWRCQESKRDIGVIAADGKHDENCVIALLCNIFLGIP
jgi:hypothetical protein